MVTDLILVPLGLGLICYVIATITPARLAEGLILSIGAAGLFIEFWGLPPFPATSSKHKIIYLLFAVSLAASFVPKMNKPIQVLAILGFGLATFVWLNWRRFAAGLPVETILLCALAIAAVAYGMLKSQSENGQPFLWPVGIFFSSLGLGVVGLLSGYLGLGQATAGLTAYQGGLLLIPYAWIAFGRNADVPKTFNWVGFAIFAVLSVGMASFATNLHPFAFMCVLITLLSPLFAARLPTIRSGLLQPFVFAATALPSAGIGIATAFLHF